MSHNAGRLALFVCVGLAVTVFATAALAAQKTSGSARTFESKYYLLETEVAPERARRIAAIMDGAGKEYDRRFQGFRGVVRQKPRLRVFTDRLHYLEAVRAMDGDPGDAATRGMFSALDGVVYTYDGWEVEPILKHECFHQFARIVVGGELPTWVDEGLAEYFMEGVFEQRTGRLRLGAIPQWRVELLQQAAQEKSLFSVNDILQMTSRQWHENMTTSRADLQYTQAWALCHFLVHAEKGKYVKYFEAYLQNLDHAMPHEAAFRNVFGSGTDALQVEYTAYLKTLEPSGPLD